MVSQPSGYPGGAMWHYPNPAMQPVPAVYYMPGSHVPSPGNASIQPVPIRATVTFQSYPVAQGQVPMGFRRVNHQKHGRSPWCLTRVLVRFRWGRNAGSGPDAISGRVSQGS
ncbi:hypothetical protein Salat_2078100 [Sesamum alatum]|uniref:Uncharacterized protein n=1 Tax=Sesamum alatum TaxID=300844 RepID=A0AAE1Y109_9LAMI|nr:hypothetical protein Salat_2078100 [Sesamum alatum]